jgi:hypothetical protein
MIAILGYVIGALLLAIVVIAEKKNQRAVQ